MKITLTKTNWDKLHSGELIPEYMPTKGMCVEIIDANGKKVWEIVSLNKRTRTITLGDKSGRQ